MWFRNIFRKGSFSPAPMQSGRPHANWMRPFFDEKLQEAKKQHSRYASGNVGDPLDEGFIATVNDEYEVLFNRLDEDTPLFKKNAVNFIARYFAEKFYYNSFSGIEGITQSCKRQRYLILPDIGTYVLTFPRPTGSAGTLASVYTTADFLPKHSYRLFADGDPSAAKNVPWGELDPVGEVTLVLRASEVVDKALEELAASR